jgi:hypothetical protein
MLPSPLDGFQIPLPMMYSATVFGSFPPLWASSSTFFDRSATHLIVVCFWVRNLRRLLSVLVSSVCNRLHTVRRKYYCPVMVGGLW